MNAFLHTLLTISLLGLTGCSSNRLPEVVQKKFYKLGLRHCPAGFSEIGKEQKPRLAQWCEKKDKRRNLIKSGKEVRWFENGQQMISRTYNEDGLLSGVYREWNKFGQLVIDGSFEDGQEVGSWDYYDNDGVKIKTIDFGSSGTRTTIYKNLAGIQIKTNQNEEVTDLFGHELSCSTKYVVRNGEAVIDGKFRNCDLETGKIIKVGEYKNGKETGNWQFFYNEGSRKAQGNFLNGEKSGNWFYWDEAGLVSAIESHSQGMINNLKSKYYISSKPVLQLEYYKYLCLHGDVDRCDELYDLYKDSDNGLTMLKGFYEDCVKNSTDDFTKVVFCRAQLGHTLFEMKKYSEAAKIFESFCLSLDISCSTYGSALYHSSKVSNAIAVLKKTILHESLEKKCSLGHAGSCYNLSCAHAIFFNAKIESSEKAEDFLRKALRSPNQFKWKEIQSDPDLTFILKGEFLKEIQAKIKII